MNNQKTLYLDDIFENIYGKKSEHKYKLIRESDQLTKTSLDVKWLGWNEGGNYQDDFEDIKVGRSLLMSPFNTTFTWMTTSVTEIIEQKDDYIKFKTKNSTYELFILLK
jgi:hypothetical protein